MVTLEEALAQRDQLQVLFDHTFDRAKEIAAERDAARKVATDLAMMIHRLARAVEPHNLLLYRDAMRLLELKGLKPSPLRDAY